MTTPATFRLYKGDQVLSIGVPLILIAIDATDENYRRTEFYLFVFNFPEGLHFVKRRFQFNGVPRELMSDEVLLSQTFDSAKAGLEQYVEAKRREIGQDAPSCERLFSMAVVEPQTLLVYLLRRQLFDQARLIRSETYCQELERFFDVISHLKKCSVEESDGT